MKANFLYRLLKKGADMIYPGYELCGTENLPEEPYILVGNHAQIHGPAISQLRLPGENYTWCNGEMLHMKEVPAYAGKDFWSEKPGWAKPFYGFLSYLIAPLCVFVFGNANVIPVYRDARGMNTLKQTAQALTDGANVVIFPEEHQTHNHIVYEFQQGFVDTARIFCRKTKQKLSFVPMYIAPALHKICFGSPVYYSPEADRKEEQQRISEKLMQEITDLAEALPPHRVVPYENIAKREYPYNRTR